MRARQIALIGLCWVAAPSCREPAADPVAPPEPVAPRITIERCAERLTGDRCVIPRDGRLIVTSTPPAALELTIDGASRTSTASLGERVLTVAEDARALVVSWRGRRLVRSTLLPPSDAALPALLAELGDKDAPARLALEAPALLPGPRRAVASWREQRSLPPAMLRLDPWTLRGCSRTVRGACVLPPDGVVELVGPTTGRAELIAPRGEREVSVGTLVVRADERTLRLSAPDQPARDLELLPPDTAFGALWAHTGILGPSLTSTAPGPRAARTSSTALADMLPGPRARALFELARLDRRKPDLDAAEAHLLAAVATAHEAGVESLEARARFLLSYIYSERWKDEAARAILEPLPSLADTWIEGELLRQFHLGIVHRNALRLSAAMSAFELSGAQAHRIERALALDRSTLARDPTQMVATSAMALGRYAEAWAALMELARTADATSCDERVDLETNLAWAGYLALRAGQAVPGADADVVRAHYQAALAAGEGCSPTSPKDVANVQLQLALLELHVGRVDAAREAWAAAQRGMTAADDDLRAASLHIEWAAALAQGELGRAATAAQEMVRIGRAHAQREVEWSGLLGVGAVAEARHRDDEAATAYRRAEELATEDALFVPVDRGLLTFLSARQASAARWVSLELRRHNPALALEVVRRAMRRAVASATIPDRLAHTPGVEAQIELYHEARRDLRRWDPRTARGKKALADTEAAFQDIRARMGSATITDAPLRAPAAGEVLVTWFVAVDGWYAFVARGPGAGDVHAIKLGAPPEARTLPEVARWALGPVAPFLEGAHKIRLQPFGWLASVDLHAAEQLGDAAEVVYGLDIPARVRTSSGAHATVVGLADSDIPLVADEIAAVAAQLGPTTETITGTEARIDAVGRALTRASHLHFAGHARYGGRDGLESRLELFDGPLTAGDILMLPAVPQSVVLSSCEAARAADQGQGFGVAQALSMAGARVVIAPSRPIMDAAARLIMKHVYEDQAALGWAAAVRKAQLELGRSAAVSTEESAVFRVIEP